MNPLSLDQVTVVCVTYHSRSLVDDLIQTLQAFPHVIVVDNGSDDGIIDVLKERLPHVKLIARDDNLGFGRANNLAMTQVQTPYALLLNPDSSIEAKDVLKLLDTLCTYPDAAVVAPQSWRGGNVPQMCFRPAFYEYPPAKPYRVPAGTCCAKWLHGCCLLLSTEKFREINGFDEYFFLYYEDDDLCLRFQQCGYACLFEPGANARHKGGASSRPSLRTRFLKHFHYARSRHWAIRKYQGTGAARWYLIKTLLSAAIVTPLYGIALQRKHFVKWVAWGCSAFLSAVRSKPLLSHPKT
ncbi:glycosyltransferase family 2 protein [Dyella sp. M7H15-1]|uniref:glycosyltransferase family 2 protein n=1 Tax=Dyella sp. M7H15-1 TaxID=2501295 RepID=UPI00100516F7|nr:glycosyltransferase family 2 protein [Dyella sp. M7H15-1]QAU24707.1 glycosyltransferase family 2 protein [Dyella sp. M7H15-1]